MPRKHKSSGPATPVPLAGPQRLNKLLAAAGLGSRREVEQYILEGRIEIDGQPVTDLATKVDPETTQLTFDGSAIKIFRPVYFALNKPVGVLSTNRDPSGRMRAIDLINVKERIFSAGRLDRSSEGLMLLTNDGELAQRLSHPRYGIQKLYLATVQGEVTQADLEKLIRGVRLAEGYAKVDAVKLRKQRSGAADLEIALSEGKNREIRRILARLGHKVVGLKRLAIGPLRLGQLPTGGWRPLTKHEIQALYAAATTGRRKKRGTGKPLRKPRSGEDDSAAPVMAAGQFDRYNDDEDDFGPSLDEIDGDGDEEMIVLGDDSLSGTIIPYDDDDVEDDGGSMEDMFGDEDDDEFDDDVTGDDELGDEDEAPMRRSPSPRGSREQSSTRSPHDLRNRNRATGTGRGERSGYQGSRGSRPASSAPRGAKKTSSRPASSGGPRSGAPRSGSRTSSSRPDSSGPRSGAPRSGAPRSSSGPRSGGPRSGSSAGGRPAQGGAGRSAPSRSGPSRSGPSRTGTGAGGPSRGGAGRSGPGRSSGQGGAGRSGPGSNSGPRSGPSRGGPKRGGSQSGPSRGGSSGPSRGGPRSGGPRGGSGRGGPGRSGPSKGRGGGGKR